MRIQQRMWVLIPQAIQPSTMYQRNKQALSDLSIRSNS